MKIGIIGAGSVRFSLQLIGDIAQTEELADCEICMMDVNETRLNATYSLAKKYCEELGSNIQIEKTMNLEEAIKGASFIINTAYPYPKEIEDGYKRWEIVTEIGEKHGYYRGIDSQEFNMVSTYSYVICSYPDIKLALDIAEKIEKLAPNAWLMQTANPVFEITQIVKKLTKAKIVGFCHGSSGVNGIFNRLNLPSSKVDWQVAGINHGIWLNRFNYEGKNAYELLDKWIEEESYKWESREPWDIQLSPAAIDMYRFYGMIPIGDTVRNGSWKYNYNLETKKKWYGKFGGIDNEIERPKFHNSLRESRKRMIELSKEIEKDPNIKLTEVWPEIFKKGVMSGEQHVPFINALAHNKQVRLILNVENKGIIKDIPDDIVVEVPVLVDKSGLHPQSLEPDLDERIKEYYLIPRIMRMKMALEAYIKRDVEILKEFLVRDPRTKSFKQVEEVLSDIMNHPINKELKEYFNV
ncbi:alpha-glucosidase AglA [Petrotoga halophila]|uniref:Alpha-glucosidase n=1 Tax=Petrotoga halophila DSM 16923 TaxID=1122953 RepID=A0A2S5EA39_9BACT|nr:alpha-glucosidase AglA [Petrotoga halophila]POZ89982.1 alpha-glucosidase [Petrotoga halophila DSM 16923]